MKFGIIGAMEEEIRILKDRLNHSQTRTIHSVEMTYGYLGDHEIILVKSGIGKVNATISCVLLIEEFKPDYIINTGSAGAVDPGLEIGDLVLGQSFIYHDVDVTSFGYQPGQMAGMPEYYYPDSHLLRLAQQECRHLGIEPIVGTIVSGDQFVSSLEALTDIQARIPRARACEMESTAIAQTCHLMEVPFVIIRAISDNANGQAQIDFHRFILEAGAIAASLVERIIFSY